MAMAGLALPTQRLARDQTARQALSLPNLLLGAVAVVLRIPISTQIAMAARVAAVAVGAGKTLQIQAVALHRQAAKATAAELAAAAVPSAAAAAAELVELVAIERQHPTG